MHKMGVCRIEDIAEAVACPAVAKHPRTNEVVVYGGAVHLSKESITAGVRSHYGYAALDNENGWRFLGENNYFQALSQEHGIIRMDSDFFSQV